jgi:murein L,D-transpeptidase YcbB/YkuD
VIPAHQDAAAQAAVDAAVTQAIRDDTKPAPAPARSPKQAAGDLQHFLIKTGRFGTLKDRPAEVIQAQRDLGVKADGIVGPKTRAAARKQGVALPPVK